jgi:ribose/xylose/arabinose/galactoside ABC-type transport system permease subunit
MRTLWKRLASSNLGLVWLYIFILLFFYAVSPNFRSPNNVRNILSGYSHIAIMAVGVTFPILTGGIDLSVGAIMGLVGMVAFDILLLFNLPGWVAVAAGLLVGVIAGWINGVLITRFRIQPFIATLATMVAYRGLTYGISGRQINQSLTVVAIQDPFFRSIDSKLGQIPMAFIYLLVLVVVTMVLLKFTRFGINLYSLGGNETAARLAGINVDRLKRFAYIISGLCTAVATLILTSRMGTSQESLGLTFELSAIAAAIVGGVSLNGGKGNTFSPAVGAFMIGTIFTGLTILGVTAYAQPVIIGIVLLIAVGYDRFVEYRRARRVHQSQHSAAL